MTGLPLPYITDGSRGREQLAPTACIYISPQIPTHNNNGLDENDTKSPNFAVCPLSSYRCRQEKLRNRQAEEKVRIIIWLSQERTF